MTVPEPIAWLLRLPGTARPEPRRWVFPGPFPHGGCRAYCYNCLGIYWHNRAQQSGRGSSYYFVDCSRCFRSREVNALVLAQFELEPPA